MSIKLGSSLLAGNLDKNMYPSKDEMNELFSSSVKLDGDQEIDGVKTFNDNLYAPNQLDYTNITNCLTHIPQDIKLELVDGTLTLKAGSKVYVPNGFETDGTTPKFDVVVVESDISATSNENGQVLYCLNKDGTFLSGGLVNRYVSGTSDSLSGQTYHTWYDTSTNLIKKYSSSSTTINHYDAFPICFVTCTGVISSIDHVFNGFGYIGSTVFALPGVKGLAPNGRNDDGSLRNEEWITNKVITRTFTNTFSSSNGVIALNSNEPIEGYLFGTIPMSSFYYNSEENRNYNLSIINQEWRFTPIALNATLTSGVITSFNPKTTFHTVDYNEVKSIVYPSQTGNAGKALLTDGENAYWGDTSGVIIRDWSL